MAKRNGGKGGKVLKEGSVLKHSSWSICPRKLCEAWLGRWLVTNTNLKIHSKSSWLLNCINQLFYCSLHLNWWRTLYRIPKSFSCCNIRNVVDTKFTILLCGVHLLKTALLKTALLKAVTEDLAQGDVFNHIFCFVLTTVLLHVIRCMPQ